MIYKLTERATHKGHGVYSDSVNRFYTAQDLNRFIETRKLNESEYEVVIEHV